MDRSLTLDERDRWVASEIRAGRCPSGNLAEGETLNQCPLAVIDCICLREMAHNPYLEDLYEGDD